MGSEREKRLEEALRTIDRGRHSLNATEMAAIAYSAIAPLALPSPLAEMRAAAEWHADELAYRARQALAAAGKKGVE